MESGHVSGSDPDKSHHAFARTRTTPTGWSMASNESLFSIHSGNTSFSKEQLSLMCTPGELAGYNCDSINISSPLIELPITRQFPDLATKSGNLDDAQFSPHSRSISSHSDASFKSFIFPILAGEEDKCGSLNKDTKKKKEQSKSSTSLEENTDISQENPKPEDSRETSKKVTLKTQTRKSTKKAGSKKWFTCFSSCSSSS